MVTLDEANRLLEEGDNALPPERDQSAYRPLRRFHLGHDRQYKQQFGDMYFLRLVKIKPAVEAMAAEAFGDVVIGGEPAKKVDRVLDVRQGELCWVSGTVYMDMPFKPNVLEDVSKDRLLSTPHAVKKYIPEDDDDDGLLGEGRGSVAILLEDDSGRIRLVGKALQSVLLVTGCITAVLGTENEHGELEVLDLVFPDLPPQPERWQLSAAPPPASGDEPMVDGGGSTTASPTKKRTVVAIVSGLHFSGPHGAAAVETALLLEYLLGEALAADAQRDAVHISRLIIAGNSIAPAAEGDEAEAEPEAEPEAEDAAPAEQQHDKKYGYDSSAYNPVPSALLDDFLAELLPSMPVTLLPGASDPANASVPQQPIHAAMFPQARVFTAAPGLAAAEAGAEAPAVGWLDTTTNPWEGEVAGWRFLGTSGQTIDDIQKYVASSDRLDMLEATCRWRCSAPTAPDTLWSYPFQEDDPFVLEACPHVYFAGSQPAFATRVITGPGGQRVRLVAVPVFAETHEVVLLDTETLEATRVRIGRARGEKK